MGKHIKIIKTLLKLVASVIAEKMSKNITLLLGLFNNYYNWYLSSTDAHIVICDTLFISTCQSWSLQTSTALSLYSENLKTEKIFLFNFNHKFRTSHTVTLTFAPWHNIMFHNNKSSFTESAFLYIVKKLIQWVLAKSYLEQGSFSP